MLRVKKLPYTEHIVRGRITAQATGKIPKWCPLEDANPTNGSLPNCPFCNGTASTTGGKDKITGCFSCGIFF